MNDYHPLITIIIPIYNAEKYLEGCITSVINQTYTNLEIILVDDGSTDNSPAICDKKASLDNRIIVVHQANKGLQVSRTVGVKMAKGEYVGFVDADDWIEPTMFELLINNVKGCDIVTSGFLIENELGEVINKVVDLVPEGIYEANYIVEKYLFLIKIIDGVCTYSLVNAVWCKLFRAELLKEVIDSVNIGVSDAEDFVMTRIFMLNCKQIKILHDAFYHYCVHEGSMVSRVNKSFVADWTKIYDMMESSIASHKYENVLRKQFQRFFMYEIFRFTEYKIGVDQLVRFPQYVFPGDNYIEGRKVILWGAGNVGISYYKRWITKGVCNVIMWLDSKDKQVEGFENLKIYSPSVLVEQANYDYVVLATASEKTAYDMKQQCLEFGIKEEKVLYFKPRNCIDELFWNTKLDDIGGK